MRSASEFRQMARETLSGNWKLAMGTGLAASLIGAEIADTAPNGITELQKVIQARPEVKNVLTQVFLMRSMLLPLVLLLIWGLMVVIIGGAGQMGYARFHLNLAEKKEASFSDLFSQFSRITDGSRWPCTALPRPRPSSRRAGMRWPAAVRTARRRHPAPQCTCR